MKKKQLLVLVLAMACIAAISVTATLAYLQSDDSVTNTFTVGKVEITLDETDVDDSTPDKDRDQANTYKIYPGQTYTKDPIIHVTNEDGIEDCWLFVTVDNEIANIEAKNGNTIADQMEAKGWTALEGAFVTEGEGESQKQLQVYYNEAKASAGDNVTVFEQFTIDGSVDNETLARYEGKTVVVKAYAIQAEGFETADAAWTAAGNDFFD